MGDNRRIIIEMDGSCSGTTSFTAGHALYDPSEKDQFIFREARQNPRAVINRLIRTKGDRRLIERMILDNDLEDEFATYLFETA